MCTSNRLTPLCEIRASRSTTLLPAAKSAVVDRDFLALGCHPDSRLHRAAAIETQRHRETLAGKYVLRRRDALHLHGQRRGAAGGHGEYGHAALPRAQRFGQRVAAIFIAVADQQYAPLRPATETC